MPNRPVGTCAECETEDRVLKYARGTMCCKYRCQRAAHALVVARKGRAAGKGDGGDKKLKAPPTFCYEVVSVHGQRHLPWGSLAGVNIFCCLVPKDPSCHNPSVGRPESVWPQICRDHEGWSSKPIE